MGRLVRTFADIDDFLSLYICRLTNLNESQGFALLGRTAIGTKLQIAHSLAAMTSPQETKELSTLFNANYADALRCRNAAAHGVLLGRTENDELAFLTTEANEPIVGHAVRKVYSYSEVAIIKLAEMSEISLPLIRDSLKLGPLLEKRRRIPLGPSRRGRRRQKYKQAPKPQRRSSRG